MYTQRNMITVVFIDSIKAVFHLLEIKFHPTISLASEDVEWKYLQHGLMWLVNGFNTPFPNKNNKTSSFYLQLNSVCQWS